MKKKNLHLEIPLNLTKLCWILDSHLKQIYLFGDGKKE